MATVREATAPAEARGITRDAVRMMVAYRHDLRVVHAHAHDLPQYLDEGDLVVVNTSGTLAAAVDALGEDGTPLVLHLSQQLSAGQWLVELRRPDGGATQPWFRRRQRASERESTHGDDRRVPSGWSVAAKSASRPASSRRNGCGSPRSTSTCRCSRTSRCTVVRSATAT